MNNYEVYEDTINLKDLFIYILRKWRFFVLGIILGAVILGGYKAIKKPQPVSEAVLLAAEEAQEILDEQEEEWLKQNQKTIRTTNNSIAAAENQITLLESQIAVKEDENEKLQELVSNWEDQLHEVREWESLAVYVEDKTSVAEQIMLLNSNILSAQNQIGSNQIELLSCETEIASLERSIEELLITLEEANKDEYEPDETLLEKVEAAFSTEESSVGMGTVAKYAVLGAFLGVFLVCGIIFLQYLSNKKLLRADELKEQYGIYILGSLHSSVNKKRNVIDKLLDRFAGYCGPVDEKTEYGLVAARVQLMSGGSENGQPEQIMVTGTISVDLMNQVYGHLREMLPQERYRVSMAENPVYNPQQLLQMKECSVLLVEGQNISDKDQIDKLIEVLDSGKVKIIGAVIL